jgi:CRP-like cAMP-binding protein
MNLQYFLEDESHTEQYRSGDILFQKGQLGEYMYVVLAGELVVLVDGTSIRTLGPGDIFGELALIDNAPRSADVVAKTDCVVVPVDERRFLFLVHENPMFALHVMRVMAHRLRN